MLIVAVSGREEVTNLGLPPPLQGRAPQLAQLSSSLLHCTTLLAQLPSSPLQLMATVTAIFYSLAQAQPATVLARLLATPLLPSPRDGALQPGTLGCLLARQESVAGECPALLAFLQLCTVVAGYESSGPAMAFLLQEVIPLYSKWRYKSPGDRERVARLCLTAMLAHTEVEEGLGRCAQDRGLARSLLSLASTGRYCTSVPLHLCTSVPLNLCTSVPLHLCTSVPLHLCTSVPLYLCTSLSAGECAIQMLLEGQTNWESERGAGGPGRHSAPRPPCPPSPSDGLAPAHGWASGGGHRGPAPAGQGGAPHLLLTLAHYTYFFHLPELDIAGVELLAAHHLQDQPQFWPLLELEGRVGRVSVREIGLLLVLGSYRRSRYCTSLES